MSIARFRIAPPSWLRQPRRTARRRLTALYGGLFLLSGAALVAVTYALFERATQYKNPALPKIPHTPSISDLQLLPAGPGATGGSGQPSQTVIQAQQGLAELQKAFANSQPVATSTNHVNVFLPTGIGHVQDQLTQAQQALAQGQRQLAGAVHQLSQIGVAQAAQRAADSHELLVNSGIALGIVAVLALLAGWLVAGRMLRPIRTITSTARRISSSNLHERLALDGPEDELKELGDTLDGLFARLEAAFEAQRRFVANASHELRTPLTAERALLQVALDDPATTLQDWRDTATEVLASSDEQAHLIEALLTLASSESGLHGLQPVDLSAAAGAGLSDLQPQIDRLGIAIEGVTAPAPLDGDPMLVERLVVNLLQNAVCHNVTGGRVEVVTGVKEGRAFVSVTNTGPVIAPAEVERLFQPFQRLHPGRAHYKDGHGLGLSIVRAIASAHGATIAARPVAHGGLSVSVVFPRPRNLVQNSELPRHDGDRGEMELATT